MPVTAPIVHPSAWRGCDLAGDPSWSIALTPRQQDEVRAALARALARGLTLADLTPDTFALPGCMALLREVATTLRDGRGFVLLRGFPIEGWTVAEAELGYGGFCAHLGAAVTQNAQGEFVAHITDKGPTQGLARGYATANEAKFHIDLTDVVGLLCLRQAKEGGQSRIVSSIAVLDAVIRERPDLLPVLLAGFPWDRRDEHGPGEAPEGPRMPVFSHGASGWTCRYNRGFIEAAFRRRNAAMPKDQKAALDFIDEVALRKELVLEMDFRPGDIQLLANDTILHARTAFADHPEPERKRLLLRIWLQLAEPRILADSHLLRDAFVRYGSLGRTHGEWEHAQPTGKTRAGA